MICPNCDGMLNASGCQSCGWKTGESFPAHRLVPGTANPLKDGFGLYPPQIGEPRVMQIVQSAIVPIVHPAAQFQYDGTELNMGDIGSYLDLNLSREVHKNFGKDEPDVEETALIEPPIPDPVIKSVQ